MQIKKYLSRLTKPAILNILITVFSQFGLGFGSYYFKLQGLGLYKIIMIWAIAPLASIPVVIFSKTWNIKRRMRYGILCYAGMALTLLFYSPVSFIIYGILAGLNLAWLWVSFNYVFFKQSTVNENAKDSSVYFMFGPFFSIVLPQLSALIIAGLGYRFLFFITAMMSAIPFWYVRGKFFDYELTKSFKQANRDFSGLRIIEFFNGSLHYFQGNFLAMYALLFLKTEYQVGGFLSYLGLISLVAAFVVAHISDKTQKRVGPLYPILISMAILIMIMPAINKVSVLVIFIGLYAILDNLSLPLRFAFILDSKEADIGFWRMGELYANIGRTIIFTITSLFLYLGNKWLAFGVFALLALLYPFVMSWQKSKL